MVFIPYALVLLAAAVGGLFGAWLRIRRLRSRAVVQTLASIVGQNLPLSTCLRAAARGESRALRKTYTRLALRLEVGDDLSAALRVSMPACPGDIIGAVQAGERGGTLPSVLQSLAGDARRELDEFTADRPPWWYPLLLLLVLAAMLTFFHVGVLPKFREIFADFGTALPAITVSVLGRGPVGGPRLPWLVGGGVLILLILLQVAVGRNFLPRVPERMQPLYAAWDTLVWFLPITRQIARNRALARQLPILHAAIRAGHDLGPAGLQAACVDANFHARWRLARWTRALTAGADPLQSARKLGFPAPFLHALAGAREHGDLATRLGYLAAYYQALQTHWEQIVLSALMPLLVLLSAMCVGYIVVALFLALSALINGVLASVY